MTLFITLPLAACGVKGKLKSPSQIAVHEEKRAKKSARGPRKTDWHAEAQALEGARTLRGKSLPAPQLAKLDIQGFELEALKGAKSLFGVTELFILEVSLYEFLPSSPVVSEVVAFMAARGYEVYDIPGFARRPFDSALGQIDLAFARKGGFLMARTDW